MPLYILNILKYLRQINFTIHSIRPIEEADSSSGVVSVTPRVNLGVDEIWRGYDNRYHPDAQNDP